MSRLRAISRTISLFNLGGGKTQKSVITSTGFLVVAFEVCLLKLEKKGEGKKPQKNTQAKKGEYPKKRDILRRLSRVASS